MKTAFAACVLLAAIVLTAASERQERSSRACFGEGERCGQVPCCGLLECTGLDPRKGPNAFGICRKRCAKQGEMCAGFAGIQCCGNLRCTGIPKGVADGAGTCKRRGY